MPVLQHQQDVFLAAKNVLGTRTLLSIPNKKINFVKTWI
jgi:hypothetical protein